MMGNGLNGAVLCDASADAQALVDGSFGTLAAFDETVLGDLGAISGAAYGG